MRSAPLSSEALRLLSYCPLCQVQEPRIDVRTLRTRRETEQVYLRCQTCRHALLAFVRVRGEMISSIAFVTDLRPGDLPAGLSANPVTLDEVLEIHEALGSPSFLRT